MSAGQAIYAKLKTVAAVTAIVGTGDDARIYPHSSPPQLRTYPLIAWRCSDDESGEIYAAGVDDLISETIEIACIADTYAAARALHNAVKEAIDGQGGIWGWITVRAAFKEGGAENEFTQDGTDRKLYSCESTYVVWYDKPAS